MEKVRWVVSYWLSNLKCQYFIFGVLSISSKFSNLQVWVVCSDASENCWQNNLRIHSIWNVCQVKNEVLWKADNTIPYRIKVNAREFYSKGWAERYIPPLPSCLIRFFDFYSSVFSLIAMIYFAPRCPFWVATSNRLITFWGELSYRNLSAIKICPLNSKQTALIPLQYEIYYLKEAFMEILKAFGRYYNPNLIMIQKITETFFLIKLFRINLSSMKSDLPMIPLSNSWRRHVRLFANSLQREPKEVFEMDQKSIFKRSVFYHKDNLLMFFLSQNLLQSPVLSVGLCPILPLYRRETWNIVSALTHSV